MDFLGKLKSILGGRRLDVSSRFELEKASISGTMSNFRVAREIKTGKRLGLKFLDKEKAGAFEARFKGLNKPSEGEIAVQINHPNVVETYEYGITTTGEPYILMQFVEGYGLSTLIQAEDPRLEDERVQLIRQMAESLEAVHEAGFIHRDICPRNYISDREVENVTLIDFGLTVPDTTPFRQPGNRTGTPLYMAPEIVRRRETDKRVDIFALGVTVYRLLTLRHPWPGEDLSGKAALAHDTVPPTDIRDYRPYLNKNLSDAVNKCLAANPDNRPESAAQFLRMIRMVRSEEGA